MLRRTYQRLMRSRWPSLDAPASHRPRALELAELESRVLLSAAPLPAPPDPSVMPDGLDPSQSMLLESTPAAPSQEADHHPRREVVFIDGSVEGAAQLSEEFRNGAGEDRTLDVWLLDSGRDGIEQISDVLSSYTGLDAVHLFSHGADGKLRLGNSWLESPHDAAYAGRWSTWQASMRDGADLLLYGCDLAASDQGRAFVEALSTVTGMDAAASIDDTGHESLGGDWDLEFNTGGIETASIAALSTELTWRHLLSVTPVAPAAPFQPGVDVQKNADVAVYNGGSFVGVAESSNDGSGAGIFGQLFNSSGLPTGSSFLINQTTLNQQIDPAVAIGGGSSNFIVVWTSEQSGDFDVYARIYDSSGTALTGELLVNATHTAGAQRDADVAVDQVGNFVVVWEGEGPGDGQGIFGQRFFADGTANGALFRVNSSTVAAQENASVAMDFDGDFVVTWTDFAPSDPIIRGQRFNASGVGQGEFAVQASFLGRADLSSVAMDGFGNFVVAWGENNVDGDNDGVLMRRFDLAGGALSGDVLVNTTTTARQFDPSISMDLSGYFVISWTSENQDGSNNGVVVRAFHPDGTPAISELLVNSYTNSNQHVSQVSINHSGEFVVVWEGESAGDPEGVYGRLYHWSLTDLIVDTTNDVADGDTTSAWDLLSNPGADGLISLREAILAANNTLNSLVPDVILFNIPGSGPHTITLASALPTITDAVLIDGWSEPDFVVTPVIELNGASAGAGSDGLRVTAAGSTIRGLAINRFSGDAIELNGGGGNVVVGNYLGTNVAGTASLANSGGGLNIVNSANNLLGGTTALARNLISGNLNGAINIDGAGSTGNLVQGNYIGLNAAGTATLTSNGFNGVWIAGGASNNTLGGTEVGAGNVIAGQNEQGIEVQGSTSTGNVIQGNYIGINAAGNAVLGNTGQGIALENAVNTIIGGTVPGAANVIGGNTGAGIVVAGSAASGNVIQGNFIGTNASGTLNLANTGPGVHFANSFEAASGGGDNNTVGGTAAGEGNKIAFNTGDGIWIESNTATGNAILGNSIYSNGQLGIDLGANGVTPNDSGDGDNGANMLQNYPVLTTVVSVSGDTTIDGSLNSNAFTAYRIEFFSTPAGDATGFGEGRTYLGFVNATTDAAGNATFSTTLLGVAVTAGHVVTATATVDLGAGNYGSSSEFAANVVVNTSNTPPTITSNGGGTAASISVAENSITVTTVAAIDPDAPPQVLTYSLAGGTDMARFTIDANTGVLSFVSAPDFEFPIDAGSNNIYEVAVQVSDGNGGSDTQSIAVSVTNINDNAPLALNDSYSTFLSLPLSVGAPGVLANDTDSDGDPLTAVLVSGASFGSVVLNSDGSFTYTPPLLYLGPDSFTYQAFDGVNLSNVATVNINVGAGNNAPTAVDDSYAVAEDGTLIVPVAGVLTNDSDPDGNTLAAVMVSGPANGSLTLNPNGSFSYAPNTSFNGIDSFTYRASDGSLNSGVATVTINVTPVNDSPVASDDAYIVAEDGVLNVPAVGVLMNDTDVDGNPLTAVLVSGPNSGSLTLNANGSFIYTPFPDFNGTDSFTYRANDGVLDSNLATVTITVNAVNDAPVAGNDSYGMLEEGTLNVPADGVLANDSDVEGNPLTAVLASGPSNGGLTLNPDGSFTYTPNANFSGVDSFTYRANDGLLNSNLATVTINVAGTNDAPVAINDNYSVAEDGVLNVPAAGVLGNDVDVDGNPLTAVLVSGPTSGSLTFNADGSFIYTPGADFNGIDTFTYRARDALLLSNLAVVTLTVTPVNDAPVNQVPGAQSVLSGESVRFSTALGNPIGISDIDAQAASLIRVHLTASQGRVQLSPPNMGGIMIVAGSNNSPSVMFQGTMAAVNTALENLKFKADAGFVGPASLTIQTNDLGNTGGPPQMDTDVISIAVLPNAPPALDLDANNSSGAGGSDYMAFVAAGSGPWAIADSDLFLADADSSTFDSLTVTLQNLLDGGSEILTANTSGTQISASYTAGVLTLSGEDSLANYQQVLRSITYQNLAAAPTSGSRIITVVANDGNSNTNVATATIAISYRPTAVADAYAINEDAVLILSASGVLSNDTDADGDPLTTQLVTGPSHGSVVFNADGSLSYIPHANFHGIDSFTYQAADGRFLSSPATVTITVTPVNDAPVAVDDAYTVVPGSPLVVTSPAVTANDTDVEGSVLTVTLVTGPAHGQVTLNPDGSFTYIPQPDYVGSDTFTYIVHDGASDGNIATVRLTVGLVAPPLPLPTIGLPPEDSTDATAHGPVDGPIDTVVTPQPLPTIAAETAPSVPHPQRPQVASSGPASLPPFPRASDVLPLIEWALPEGIASLESLLALGSAAGSGPLSRAVPDVAAAMAAFDIGLLWNDLSELKQELVDQADVQYFMAGSAVGVSSVLTVGYVLWTIRGGSLVVGLLAQMPAWRLIDPLVVLDYLDDEPQKKGRTEEDDSLESMLERQRKEEHESLVISH